MSGQAQTLTRKEAAQKQKAIAKLEATPGTTSAGMDPECHPATPGVKANPTGGKS